MKKTKLFSLALAVLLLLTVILAGCTGGANARDDKSAASAAETSTGAAASTAAPKEKSKISFMYLDSAIDFGNASKEDNPFLNQIAEWANVEFTEVSSPPYADYNQKLNLVLASGDLPDVIHSAFQANLINRFGMEGAFLSLEKYINERPILNSIYKDSIDIIKASDGNIYAFPSANTTNYNAMLVRGDIIDDVNDGVMPQTPDEWYEVFKKIKQKYPDSVPLSGRGGILYLDSFFKAFGSQVNGNGANWWLDIETGKYVCDMEVPGTRAAIEFYRKLYAEGLLEKTFFTNSREDWISRMYYNKFVMTIPGRYSHAVTYNKDFVDNCNDKNAYCVFTKFPVAPGYNVTDYELYGFAPGKITPDGHMLSISAKTKDIDACLRLVETFWSQEVHDLCVYGREGIEYTVQDGKKVIDPQKSKETSYRYAYMMPAFYGWSKEYGESLFTQLEGMDPDILNKSKQLSDETYEYIEKAMRSYTPDVRYWELVKLSEETTAKLAEARELSKSIILKAIVGEITMEEYDAMAKDFIEKYQFITDEYNASLAEAKAKLGVK